MAPKELLWAFIGLILTIVGTLVSASIVSLPWDWMSTGVQTYSLGITCQIGAVLLVGCLGGQNAATISQIAYLTIGLSGIPVFTQGGGVVYLQQPTFGYLAGFIPAAWICGRLAFEFENSLETLGFSAFCGLLGIHLTGILYLVAHGWLQQNTLSVTQAILQYSLQPFPAHLAMVCAVTVVAYLIRYLMFI